MTHVSARVSHRAGYAERHASFSELSQSQPKQVQSRKLSSNSHAHAPHRGGGGGGTAAPAATSPAVPTLVSNKSVSDTMMVRSYSSNASPYDGEVLQHRLDILEAPQVTVVRSPTDIVTKSVEGTTVLKQTLHRSPNRVVAPAAVVATPPPLAERTGSSSAAVTFALETTSSTSPPYRGFSSASPAAGASTSHGIRTPSPSHLPPHHRHASHSFPHSSLASPPPYLNTLQYSWEKLCAAAQGEFTPTDLQLVSCDTLRAIMQRYHITAPEEVAHVEAQWALLQDEIDVSSPLNIFPSPKQAHRSSPPQAATKEGDQTSPNPASHTTSNVATRVTGVVTYHNDPLHQHHHHHQLGTAAATSSALWSPSQTMPSPPTAAVPIAAALSTANSPPHHHHHHPPNSPQSLLVGTSPITFSQRSSSWAMPPLTGAAAALYHHHTNATLRADLRSALRTPSPPAYPGRTLSPNANPSNRSPIPRRTPSQLSGRTQFTAGGTTTSSNSEWSSLHPRDMDLRSSSSASSSPSHVIIAERRKLGHRQLLNNETVCSADPNIPVSPQRLSSNHHASPQRAQASGASSHAVREVLSSNKHHHHHHEAASERKIRSSVCRESTPSDTLFGGTIVDGKGYSSDKRISKSPTVHHVDPGSRHGYGLRTDVPRPADGNCDMGFRHRSTFSRINQGQSNLLS